MNTSSDILTGITNVLEMAEKCDITDHVLAGVLTTLLEQVHIYGNAKCHRCGIDKVALHNSGEGRYTCCKCDRELAYELWCERGF